MNKFWVFLMIFCAVNAGDFANQKSMIDSSSQGNLSPKQSNAQEFIISYRAIIKNNALIGEEFKIAKALINSQNPHIIAICDIDIDDFSVNPKKILHHNKSAILSCFEANLNGKIRDDIKSINNEVRTKTTFKIPAQRILLDLQRSQIHIIGQK